MSYIERVSKAAEDCVLNQEELAYYARHILLPHIGVLGQRKLKAASVLVVGAGGLGCPVLQALAGAGVGTITVMDGDSIDRSNVSRQWLHRYESLGKNKAESAVEALHGLNPLIHIRAIPAMLDEQSSLDLVAQHDLVIDATDDLSVRYWIDDACSMHDRPWIHAALYRERAQMIVLWGRAEATFRKLFPEPSEAPDCAGAGMTGAMASVVGHLQAVEAIKLIVGSSNPKIGQLVSIDFEGTAMATFQMPGVLPVDTVCASDAATLQYAMTADGLEQALSIEEIIDWIDLRPEEQRVALPLPQAQCMTAEALLESGLPEHRGHRVVLICEEGVVSAILAQAMHPLSKGSLYYLIGGMKTYQSVMCQ